MRFLLLFLFIYLLSFLEVTLAILPLTLIFIFALGLEARSSVRFLWVFSGGLMIDLLSEGFFPGITILFLLVLIVTYLYHNFLPKNIFVTLILLIFFQGVYLHLAGIFPSIYKIAGGLILFFPILTILRYYLSFYEQKHLKFDFFNK